MLTTILNGSLSSTEASLIQSILIAPLTIFWIIRFRKNLVPSNPSEITLRTYVARPVMRLNWCFVAALISWAVFYLVTYLIKADKLPPIIYLIKEDKLLTLCQNTIQNLTTLCLLGIYVILSAPKIQTGRGTHQASVVFYGYILALLAAFCLDLLISFQEPVNASSLGIKTILAYFSGISQGLALCMIMGRIEDCSIKDHLKENIDDDSPFWFSAFLLLGYFYAAIQPFYPYFSKANNERFIVTLMVLALFFKICLFLLFYILNRSKGTKPSAFESFIYEMERFNIEELNTYARTFLRKHVNPFYRREQIDKGYLGIEYLKLNKFKRQKLGIPIEDEGLWITDVYSGTPAMEKGLRPGDYITHVKQQPIGFNNTLSVLLQDSKAGESVQVTWLRRKCNFVSDSNSTREFPPPTQLEQLNCTIELKPYNELMSHNTFRLTKPYLDIEYLHNSSVSGVVVKHEEEDKTLIGIEVIETQQYHIIPDFQMLKLTLELLTPGDTFNLHFAKSSKAESQNDPFQSRIGPSQNQNDPTQSQHDSTTVKWQPDHPGSPAIEIAQPPVSDFHERILKAYPNIFSEARFVFYDKSAENADSITKSMRAFKTGYIYVFDSSYNKLFEYKFYENYHNWKEYISFDKWCIWKKIETGIIYIFIGPDFEEVTDQLGVKTNSLRRGTFYCCKLSRSQKLTSSSPNPVT